MKKKQIKLHIDGFDDRRLLVSILADNGYKVRIKEEKESVLKPSKYFVIIEL